MIGTGKNTVRIEEYTFDRAVVTEIIAGLKQAAIEVGDRGKTPDPAGIGAVVVDPIPFFDVERQKNWEAGSLFSNHDNRERADPEEEAQKKRIVSSPVAGASSQDAA
jgi:hypothetical protein